MTLVQSAGDLVAGKQIIDLSTGSGTEAEALDELIRERGAELLTGMILSYPSGIGSDETAILVAGPGDGWERCRDIVMKLAGSSVHISDRPAALAVLFSALFLPRQAFMFGMIAGARLVEAAGIPVETYVSQLPQTLSAAQFYVQLVGETIPSESYSDPGASIEVYAAAYRDMLKTFGDLGVNAELPELLYNKVEQGLEAGYGDEELSALIKLLR